MDSPSDLASHSLTKKVCERVSATKEFPEDVIWVAECEGVVEVVSIVVMVP